MKSKEFLLEIGYGFDYPGQKQSGTASTAEIRNAFLKDFFNDAFTALNTAVQTNAVSLQPATTSQTQPQPQTTSRADLTPGGQELSNVRAAKQKAAQDKIDQASKPQYAQQKPLTPSQVRQAKQAAAAAKVDQQTAQQKTQGNTSNINKNINFYPNYMKGGQQFKSTPPKSTINKDPNFVLEAIERLSKFYLFEQKQMSISEFLNDFFADYVAGANANYSKYEPMIKDLTKKIEAQYLSNPKGALGMGYNKNIRIWMTQLGDLALTIYKTKKGSANQTIDQTQRRITRSALPAAQELLLPDYLEPEKTSEPPKQSEVLVGGKKWMYGPRGWVDEKGTVASASMVEIINQYLQDLQ